MWQAAFSSKSVSKKTMPVLPTRESPSTIETSPRYDAALVGAHLLADDVGAARRASPRSTRPAAKRTVRSRTICPFTTSGIVERTTPSVRRRCGVVKTSSVGMFTTISMPVVVSSEPEFQRDCGIRPTKRSVPGPRKRTPSKRRSLRIAARSPSFAMWVRQAATGIVLVEARGDGDRLPEPLHVGLAEHRLGPAGVRVADDRPGDLAVARRLEHLLGDEPRARLRDPGRVEVGEQLGLGVAGDRDQGAVLLRELVDERQRPRRRPVERVLGRVEDPRAPDVRIGVERLDVLRAALVRDLGDRADERQVVGMARDAQQLARLEVDPDLDGEAGVPRESLVRSHSSAAYTAGRIVLRELVSGAVVASLPCCSRSPRRAR